MAGGRGTSKITSQEIYLSKFLFFFFSFRGKRQASPSFPRGIYKSRVIHMKRVQVRLRAYKLHALVPVPTRTWDSRPFTKRRLDGIAFP